MFNEKRIHDRFDKFIERGWEDVSGDVAKILRERKLTEVMTEVNFDFVSETPKAPTEKFYEDYVEDDLNNIDGLFKLL